MGDLYVVPTPIGNLEDITVRALRVLRSVSLIAAEDTRHSLKLLNHYNIHTRLTSYHQHNEQSKASDLIAFLASGDVALITDAGTPGISDPGAALITQALDAGIHVIVLPGANAITTALTASGLPSASFRFYGFPPRKDGELRQFLSERGVFPETLIFYESPQRLIKTLGVMRDVLGDRSAVVGLELTKRFEEYARGSISDLIAHFEREPIRGEVTLLVQGAK
ncbi:MAG TPA: 16S rRNA (cytidine(1402)-2'-O)-methyltransferase [Phototrophicaceae bacterium]|nr:16S rRNA (cytidine(1402)-2'-O)-methyltransferase [Phototrophicaceae bacterium]